MDFSLFGSAPRPSDDHVTHVGPLFLPEMHLFCIKLDAHLLAPAEHLSQVTIMTYEHLSICVSRSKYEYVICYSSLPWKTAKWFGRPHFLQMVPHAGQFFLAN